MGWNRQNSSLGWDKCILPFLWTKTWVRFGRMHSIIWLQHQWGKSERDNIEWEGANNEVLKKEIFFFFFFFFGSRKERDGNMIVH